MPNYAIIISPIEDRLLKKLRAQGLVVRTFEFNPVLTLADVPFDKRNNGSSCWEYCNNFIEGVEWEDYRIKPKNKREAQEGNLSPHMSCNRGWTRYSCKTFVAPDNPRGVREWTSWISCNQCEFYDPKTLEGRQSVFEAIKGEYERRLAGLTSEIIRIKNELVKNRKS